MKKRFLFSFVALVILLCLIPSVSMFILPESEVRANQALAPFPRLISASGSLNTNYFTDLQDYVADHFGFRQELITCNSFLLSELFNTSNTDEVILGSDGWLFYASEGDDFLNIATITEEDAANAAISLRLIQEYVQNNGAEFIFTIAPNKSSIYPQYMPYNYVPLDQSLGNLEIMLNAMSAEGIAYADLYSIRSTLSYHKLDSHWDNAGAAAAQELLLTALGLSGTEYSSSSFTVLQDFYGDLYEMLYPTGKQLDYNQYCEFDYQIVDGDSEDITFQTVNPDKQHSLVMYRDSFGNALAPFLAQEFGAAYFSRSTPYDLTLVELEDADFVILELVERNLSTLSTRAAVIPAPIRDISLPSNQQSASLTAFFSANSSGSKYVQLTGCFDSGLRDIGTPIYAVITKSGQSDVYEATPVGDAGNGSFTLYLPQSELDDADIELSLILTYNGTSFSTETITIS